jgi:cytochrome c oxidase assembly protein Cox11
MALVGVLIVGALSGIGLPTDLMGSAPREQDWSALAAEVRVVDGDTLRLGETGIAHFKVRNLSDQPLTMSANFNVAPYKAGQYFRKLECFCFNEYVLQPGEAKQWPVVFVIDPKLPKDVKTITLSYTFFEVGGKVPPAPAGGGRV